MLRRTPVQLFPGINKFGESSWMMYYLARRIFRRDIEELQEESEANMEKRIQELIDNIDRVPPRIIANIKSNDLYAAAPRFCKQILRLLLEKNHSDHISEIERRSEVEQENNKKRKGFPRKIIRDPTASMMNTLIGDEGTKSLLVEDPVTTQMFPNNDCYANVFLVDKSSTNPRNGLPFKRIITDARYPNAVLKNMAKMELFTLELLMSRFSLAFQTNSAKQVFALSADLRHYFTQLPLPRHFRKYYEMTTVDRSGRRRVVYPRALIMGAHFSPGVAQVATWAMLLSNLDGTSEEQLKVRRSLGISDDQKFDEYLTWLPLEGGGAVFILIDNIFVLCTNKEMAERWRSRIVETTNKFGATLKRSDQTEELVIPNKSDDVEFKTLQWGKAADDGSNTIKFSGIEFSGLGRRTATEMSEFNIPKEDEAAEWKTNFRDFASFLGQCLWRLRVAGKTMLEIEDFVDLYGFAYPRENLKEKWNSETTIQQEQLQIIRKYLKICNENKWVPHDTNLQEIKRTFFLATDASGGEQRGVGIVFGENDADRLEMSWTVFGDVHDHAVIAFGELKAALLGLVEIAKKKQNRKTGALVMLAIDNIAALHMIKRGYSPRPEAREILKEMMKLLKENNMKLMLQYIKSAENPADEPSRGQPISTSKLEVLKQRFEKLENLVKKDLLRTGKNRIVAISLPPETEVVQTTRQRGNE